MLIKVMYQNNEYGKVNPFLLDELIASGKIKKFLRSEGWATISIDPIRGTGGHYKGLERRIELLKDEDKTKEQLIHQMKELRQQIAEFEISEAQRKKAEDLLKIIEAEGKQADEALKVSETRYRRLFETAKDGILLLDADTGQITDVNPFLIKMLGYSHKEFLRKKLWEVGLFKDIASSKTAFSELQEKGYIRYDNLPLKTKDGYIFNVEFVSNVYFVNSKKIIQCNIRDITERKRMEKKLKRLATTDKLTGSYNRRKFKEIIGIEIERVKRYNQPLSIIMFDIDHFKKVNDKYGHVAGDHVLKTIADIVRKNMRKTDYLFRWGGEEFLILSSETQLDKAHALAERIRKAIESYKFKKVGKVTVSFGVTEFKERDTEDSFVKRTDDAMYKAKKKGRNCVEVTI
jgi:diguanylate cyclase (GGDEF)-like protein/PAS domain S-box-containing protein